MYNNNKTPDQRPKRRREKNNPYTIYSVGIKTDQPRYYIEFDDGEGMHHCVEVDVQTFKAFDRFELDDLSQMNETARHYSDSDDAEQSTGDDTTFQTVLTHIEYEQLYSLINQLPETQKRRLLLYYFENYTYKQIAAIEGCKIQAIFDSIQVAKKFLKKNLESDLKNGL